jgi:hypothetical protein
VLGDKSSQFFLEALHVCIERIGLGKVDEGSTALVIGQAGTTFDGLLNVLPSFREIL